MPGVFAAAAKAFDEEVARALVIDQVWVTSAVLVTGWSPAQPLGKKLDPPTT